ncbi:uncharacterized protein TNCV_1403901 [Trichonephila clavipes]|nr:uncharacterized protein TNCV_1403901 [Trichonephila clavipes]
MVWGVIAYDLRSPLILIHGTMAAQGYVHDILQPHVLLLMVGLPGAIFQQDHTQQGCHKTASTPLPPFLGLLDSQICHQSRISGIIYDDKWDSLSVWSN